jgi:biopolymer transport protein ExbD
MGMSVSSKGGAMSNINITPYIDILLVLLIIFMVITPIEQLDLEVKVPQSSQDSGPATTDQNVIVVSISDTAQIAINGLDQTLGQLGSELQRIYNERSNKSMFISAGAKLPYGDVVRVIDIAKGAGVGDIGLITEQIQ